MARSKNICPDPECAREFASPNGLAIHIGRAHNGSAGEVPEEESELVVDSSADGLVQTLPQPLRDALDAYALLEGSTAVDVLVDVLVAWRAEQVESDPHLEAILDALAARRAS